jgi:hypothetical protein
MVSTPRVYNSAYREIPQLHQRLLTAKIDAAGMISKMTSPRKSASYWAVQMAICGVSGVALSGLGIGGMAFDTEEPGRWFITLLIGLAFFGTLIWLARQYRSMSKEQRAVYAWAIEQQSSADANRNPASDLAVMATARKAKDGLLTRKEIQQLQNLKPTNPYPAPLPEPPAPPVPTWSGPEL